MTIDLDGTIVAGYGGATPALQKQLPIFSKIADLVSRLPIIVSCHPGTINVRLDQPLLIPPGHADFVTLPIIWDVPPQPAEQFGFLEIEIECPLDTARQPALIYIPFNSPHFHDMYVYEVIGPFIPSATTGTRCRIHIPRSPQSLVVVGPQ